MPAERALKHPGVSLEHLARSGQLRIQLGSDTQSLDVISVETEFKYEGYIRRERATVDRLHRQESRAIPPTFQFAGVPGLSREMVERLSTTRPETLGQAGRVPGVTPAAVAVIGAYLDRRAPAEV
jgi:tRNA uridine 5-carboxymethylaminomethyl modification enzyme